MLPGMICREICSAIKLHLAEDALEVDGLLPSPDLGLRERTQKYRKIVAPLRIVNLLATSSASRPSGTQQLENVSMEGGMGKVRLHLSLAFSQNIRP